MKVDFCSDLHLEYKELELPGGDLLILAGDVAPVVDVYKAYHSTRPSPYIPGFNKFFDFFEHELAKYERVLYVFGNHEHYGNKVHKSFEMAKLVLPAHVTLMENGYAMIDGVKFIGSTLWTSMKNRDPMAIFDAKQFMSDYREITYRDRFGNYGKLHPHDTVDMHVQSVLFLKKELEEKVPTVMISHHAPSWQSIPPEYASSTVNAAYASEMSDLILDHDHLKVWVHGHVHDPMDYMIGSCRVLANPRGYFGYESIANTFQVKSFEV